MGFRKSKIFAYLITLIEQGKLRVVLLFKLTHPHMM